jgi:hypothetical protein
VSTLGELAAAGLCHVILWVDLVAMNGDKWKSGSILWCLAAGGHDLCGILAALPTVCPMPALPCACFDLGQLSSLINLLLVELPAMWALMQV